MIHEKPKPAKKRIQWNDLGSTILGVVVAIANAYANVDWSTFQLDARHIMPLLVSAAIAVGGYMTSINSKK